MSDLHLIGVRELPEVQHGDNIADMIGANCELQDNDVVVIASKVIAKAEGQMVEVDRNDQLARRSLIESQSTRILRQRGSLFITETTHGFVCANAGVDWSNVENGNALLLPRDPDRSAFKVREHLRAIANVSAGVVVSDAFGRAWRNGVVDVALGCSGIKPILDLQGTEDGYGVSQVCIVDELAAAAELVMSKTRRVPAVIIRGIDPEWLEHGTDDVRSSVIRNATEDLFR